MNPRKMQAMMKQLGISQEQIDCKKVIIEGENSRIIIEQPEVARVKMPGQDSIQIVGGEEREENFAPEISEDDVKTVVEKVGCTEEQARKVLESVNGDLAEAILELSV